MSGKAFFLSSLVSKLAKPDFSSRCALALCARTIFFVSLFFLLSNTAIAEGERTGPPPEPIVTESVNGFPSTKIFDITGYYSPQPGQLRYATGSYESEIHLNGGGVHGASGKSVYPGMIAAPSIYPFGTKMYIPGVGTTAVFDRGGAIVSAPSASGEKRNLRHDRLDIWMGYGDAGLARALAWGRRTLTVTVYGVDPSIQEKVYLEGYSESEKVVRNIFFQPKLLPEDIWYLSRGEQVQLLQKLLKEAGYFPYEPTGFYGDETRDAVFRFQRDQELVTTQEDLGAGHAGPQTRYFLEKIFQERKKYTLPREALKIGNSGEDVRRLQKVLRYLGYNLTESGIFDMETLEQLIAFQRDQGIVPHASSFGAGFFGPKTREILEKRYVNKIAHGDEDSLIDVPEYLVRDLRFGDDGPAVTRLQEELRRLNFLRIEPTGHYGDITEHAVFKFQQSLGLVGDKNSKGAGEFGPITRNSLNRLVAVRHFSNRLIAQKKIEQTALLAKAPIVPEGISFGDRSEGVKNLQEFLKKFGFLANAEATGFFGDKTRNALISFQKAHRIISSEDDVGAGRVGPQTKSIIEKFFSTTQKSTAFAPSSVNNL